MTESPASVEQIHAAFGSEDYWLARIEPNAANVVPSRARLLIDARAEIRPDMLAFVADVAALATARRGLHGSAVVLCP